MGKNLTNEEFLNKLRDNHIKDIPLEDYKGSHTKIKWICYKNNKHIFEAEPCKMYNRKHDGCIYCIRREVFVGETDMWSTRPDVASMLLNPSDGYKYFSTSSKKVDWVCPNCNNIIKDKAIYYVSKFGLPCNYCSDNMSFSEKIVHNLLTQLECDFIYDRSIEWSDRRRYDFYIKSKSLIIETHGAQHYENSFLRYTKSNRKCRTSDDESNNDKYKKDLALCNGIKHYIELDCRYSDFEYIKNSILESELSELYDLSNINWQQCFIATNTSNVVLCSDLWNEGIKDTSKISEYTGIHICTVIENLKRASQIGLCDYKPNYFKTKHKQEKLNKVCSLWNNGIKSIKEISSKTNISYGYVITLLKFGNKHNMCDYYKNCKKSGCKKVLCIETNKIYDSIASVKNDGFNPSCVSNVCNGKTEKYHNLHFKFIYDEN